MHVVIGQNQLAQSPWFEAKWKETLANLETLYTTTTFQNLICCHVYQNNSGTAIGK